MTAATRTPTMSAFSFIVYFLLFFNISESIAQDVYLCVWRNPERTMTKIFPEARDYTTVVRSITPAQREKIESTTGTPLLPGQKDTFQYFKMSGAEGKDLGIIIAASQKGTYGAIEFVVGVDTRGTIKSLYVQRSRERNREFKKREFLDLFIDKPMYNYSTLSNIYKGEPSKGTEAIINGLIKEFVCYQVIEKTDK